MLELKKILKKLMLLNDNKIHGLRSQFSLTLEEKADYEERCRESEWYAKTLGEIYQEDGLDRCALQNEIQRKLSERYDELVEKTRVSGAGRIPEKRGTYFFSTPDIETTGGTFKSIDARMKEVDDDEAFLRSCCIEGEIW